jgi:hypothetical protein
LSLTGQHRLREVVLEGKRELEELNVGLSSSLGASGLVVRDNPRLRELYLYLTQDADAALGRSDISTLVIDSPGLPLLHLDGWHELYAGLMDTAPEAGGNSMPAVKRLRLSLPTQARPKQLDQMRRTIRGLTSLRCLEVTNYLPSHAITHAQFRADG